MGMTTRGRSHARHFLSRKSSLIKVFVSSCPPRVYGVSELSMHEMSIVESILGILREEMVKYDGQRLRKVVVRNGALAGIVTESLLFAWEALTPGGEFDGAQLEVVEIPIRVACGECGEEFSPEHARCMPCPKCEALLGHKVLQGKEMLIDSIEIDDA